LRARKNTGKTRFNFKGVLEFELLDGNKKRIIYINPNILTATSPEIHVNKKRRLSVREFAIIQRFTDEHIFMAV